MKMIEFETDFEKIKERALRLLARRDHSVLELKIKLRQKIKIQPEDFEKLLSYLKEFGYLVSESDLAKRWTTEWRGSGRGKNWIIGKLKSKGLPINTLADEAQELEAAQRALQKRLRGQAIEDLSYQERGKVGRFLISRGFSTSLVATLLK